MKNLLNIISFAFLIFAALAVSVSSQKVAKTKLTKEPKLTKASKKWTKGPKKTKSPKSKKSKSNKSKSNKKSKNTPTVAPIPLTYPSCTTVGTPGDCAADSTCVFIGPTVNYCFQVCVRGTADCPTGYVCDFPGVVRSSCDIEILFLSFTCMIIHTYFIFSNQCYIDCTASSVTCPASTTCLRGSTNICFSI
jgi:hypothetical protein